jgi:hypothetical protein
MVDSKQSDHVDKSYYFKFEQVSSDVPVVIGRLAPGIFEACNANINDLKDFEPQVNFVSCGPNNAVMHTNLEVSKFPITTIGMNAVPYKKPIQIKVNFGTAAGFCFNPCVAGAGLENETPDPTGNTVQKLRHCGTGFVDVKTVLDKAWSGETLTVFVKNEALPETVAPKVEINYRVTSDITPEIAETLLKSGFFCLEFEKSAAAMKYQDPDDIPPGESANALTKWYTDVQTQIGVSCAKWIQQTIKDETIFSNGTKQTQSDLFQLNAVKQSMSSLASPAMSATPFMRKTLCDKDTDDPAGMYILAHNSLRCDIPESEWSNVIALHTHEILCRKSTGPVPDKYHKNIAKLTTQNQVSLDHAFRKLTFLVTKVQTSVAANPKLSSYSFDQAVLAEISNPGRDRGVEMVMNRDGTATVVKTSPQRYISATTENMATVASVLNSVTEDGTLIKKDDCETLAAFSEKAVLAVRETVKELRGCVNGTDSYGIMLAKLNSGVGRIVASDIWVKSKLSKLSTESRKLLVQKAFVIDQSFLSGVYESDLGLVASGSAEVACSKMENPKTQNNHVVIAGKMNRFKFNMSNVHNPVHDLHNTKQIAGSVGGHCVGVLRCTFGHSHFVDYMQNIPDVDEIATKSKVKWEQIHGSSVIIQEGTSATASVPSCNGRVTVCKGNHVMGSNTFDLASREVTYTGPALMTQQLMAPILMFTPGSRLHMNLPVDPTEAHGPQNPFPGFYRSMVVMGSNFGMTSDGVPGIDITEMCAHGLHQKDVYTNNQFGVQMVNSFDAAILCNTGTNNTLGMDPSDKDTTIKSMLIPLIRDDDVNVIEHLKSIETWRKTMDPPRVNKIVHEHQLKNNVELDSLELTFPHDSFDNYMVSGVYVPADEMSKEVLIEKIDSINQDHSGVVVSKPISVGNINNLAYYVGVRFEVFPNSK